KAIEKAAGEQKSNPPLKKESAQPEKKITQKESTATITIAELYLKQGHFDKAIEVYQELLAGDPQNLMLRQKLGEVVEKQQKESAIENPVSKLKKSDFIKPPDQKEELLEDTRGESKRQEKSKKEDDSKFTSDDILQVMRRGGKDDVVIEDKKSEENYKKTKATIELKSGASDKSTNAVLQPNQIDGLKGILADLNSIEGIMQCFIIGNDGINIVSMGETSNNADSGKQTLAIFESTQRSVAQLNQGKLNQVLVTAETGHILLVSFANFVLVVLGSNKINLGLLRLALDSAL